MVQHQMQAAQSPGGPASAPGMQSAGDPVARLLGMLAELRAEDVLTAEEFPSEVSPPTGPPLTGLRPRAPLEPGVG